MGFGGVHDVYASGPTGQRSKSVFEGCVGRGEGALDWTKKLPVASTCPVRAEDSKASDLPCVVFGQVAASSGARVGASSAGSHRPFKALFGVASGSRWVETKWRAVPQLRSGGGTAGTSLKLDDRVNICTRNGE